jgi:thioredoxin reductase (NADPH)
MSDLVIVGAGPAGISAALWARQLGLEALLLEAAPEPGGQLHLIHYEPVDFAGSVPGRGAEIAAAMAGQLQRAGIEIEREAVALGLEVSGGLPAVLTADGRRLEGAAVLVATGARRRHLGVPGEREFEGRGVSYSATRDREQLVGRRVAVIGGGDSAFENALILADAGSAVTLISRGSPRARAEFRERVAQQPGIEHLERARVTSILGNDRVEAVCVESRRGAREVATEGVVVKIGMTPNTEWCAATLDLDPAGFVRVDEMLRTSAPRIWAAGDVTRPTRPSLAMAIGLGAQALAAIRAVLRP